MTARLVAFYGRAAGFFLSRAVRGERAHVRWLNGAVTVPHPDPALCALLRADLAAAGYTADAVREAWGPLADEAIGHGVLTPALTALTGRSDPLAVLARLLFLGVREPRAHVDASLVRAGARGLVDLGLAEIDADEVVPTALLRPQDFDDDESGAGQWWIASDLDEAALAARGGGVLPTDHVLGVGGASLTLASLQLSSPVERVLDIGVGCGIQSLRARQTAERVVATDVSERALRFTQLTALLNDVDGIETRLGSLFDPVAGETFDRVVSNPPFVITPRIEGVPEYEYRDAGYAGDDLVAAFVAGVGGVLAAGGVAQLLGNWEYRDGRDGLARVRDWVEGSAVPLDAWVIEREVLGPLAYAELWVRDGGTAPGTPDYARLVSAWLDDFAARGVTAVGFGYVLLRRPVAGAEPTLARYERVTGPVSGALGPHLGDALAAATRADALDDAQLAQCHLFVAGDVTEARHHVPGAESPQVIELRQGGALGRTLDVDPALAALVGACDGDLPVGALIRAIAELLEVDPDALAADLVPRVRELLFTGFLRFTP